MCTVSFIPVKGRVFITSNRDEKRWRLNAQPPGIHTMQTGNIIFPRDGNAGGSWFAVHGNGNAVVLLNGGLIKHEPKPPYRKSRGLILLEIIDSENPYQSFLSNSFKNIEPFTAIIWDGDQLHECRWDGINKYRRSLNAAISHIWSSVTLYDDAVVAKREQWFKAWLTENPLPTQQDILHFHQFTGDGDRYNDLMMDRDGSVFTVSITSAELDPVLGKIKYLDFKTQQSYQHQILFTKAMAVNP